MNRIIAIIPRESLGAVRSALVTLDVGGITSSDVYDPVLGTVKSDEGWALEQDGMFRLEVISLPEAVEELVYAIASWVKETARHPRGMIFVTKLEGVIRIRTEETDTAAIL